MTRQATALGEPGDRPLSELPRSPLDTHHVAYRAHHKDRSPWWYASNDDGRFNLQNPDGTCYLANNRTCAVREVAGESLIELGYVTADFAASRIVSTLAMPAPRTLADLTHSDAANHGITREIHTCVPYRIPRLWAAAIHLHCFDGIRYLPRFSTGVNDIGFALFGAAGQHDHPKDPAPQRFESAALGAGIKVVRPPRTVTILDPPTT